MSVIHGRLKNQNENVVASICAVHKYARGGGLRLNNRRRCLMIRTVACKKTSQNIEAQYKKCLS